MQTIFAKFISLLVVSVFSLVHGLKSGATYSVKCFEFPTRRCQLVEGLLRHPNIHAHGTYVDEIDKDGWGKIWVHGDNTVEGWYQAGYLEGVLTSKRIYQHFVSWYNYQFGSNPLTNSTSQFIMEQYHFAKSLGFQDSDDAAEKDYNLTVRKLLSQFQGLLDGQNIGANSDEEKLSLLDLLLLEAAGDLYDIIPAVNPTTHFGLKLGKVPAQEFDDEWHKVVSCSAFIKLKSDNSDVFAGHNSWTTYQSMLRIYKNYDLDGGRYRSSHSSKPGMIYSKDDFYVLPNHRLVVMETTNGVMNSELYKAVTTRSLLTWQRLPVVNTLASTGKDWVQIVSKYNSGTYANQWMILDMKLFQPGIGVTSKSDFLWIVELAPGIAAANDVTSIMLQTNGGYWPSYNVPYDEMVYVVSGFQKAYETYGDQYSYTKCPRAQIFSRNQSQADSFEAARSLLRYNDWQSDPLSQGSASNAISSRYDLRTSSPKAYGGVDTKITSFTRIHEAMQKHTAFASAQNGPTTQQQKPFVWSTSQFADQIHLGQPDVFNFDFVEMNFYQY